MEHGMGIGTQSSLTGNIVLNHDFSRELLSWHSNCCDAYVVAESHKKPDQIAANSGLFYAVATKRTESWQGLEQDITERISPGCTYLVSAYVRVWGCIEGSTSVQATLRLEKDTTIEYLFNRGIKEKWHQLEGEFFLSSKPKRVVLYFEGPPPGVDLLIDSVLALPSSHTQFEAKSASNTEENIIRNPRFEDGLRHWSGRGCKLILHDCMGDGKILPYRGKVFASTKERRQSWNGIQQEITGRVQGSLHMKRLVLFEYLEQLTMQMWKPLYGFNRQMVARSIYALPSEVQASDKEWVHLHGKFLINGSPSRVVIYLEGPPPGTDILAASFDVNVQRSFHVYLCLTLRLANEGLVWGEYNQEQLSHEELTNWHPMGACTLKLCSGSPVTLPSLAKQSLGHHLLLSGRYILATTITDRLRLHLTYQISAWVRVGAGTGGPQNINVALNVGHRWVNGGQIEVNDGQWYEVSGSFRLEEGVAEVTVYVQGPSPGVDLMVAGLHIFPVDRIGRFEYLKKQTDKVRKRDVVLRFHGPHHRHQPVRVRQTKNSFPFGACISRSILDNEDFVDFFLKNFTWAVFANELKWAHTEPQRGAHNYADADEMLVFCERHGIQETLPTWVRSLNRSDLVAAIQARAASVLTRYRGRFRHWDVNNEMLHGSLRERLGADLWVHMFRRPRPQVHPGEICAPRPRPPGRRRRRRRGRDPGPRGPPVGPMIAAALDRLAALGLPIWLTEVDVSAADEHVRAEDLEVVLREAYAHPTVGGVMLWGFWETATWREHSHLGVADGGGGAIDGAGEFRFRGFHGRMTWRSPPPQAGEVNAGQRWSRSSWRRGVNVGHRRAP
ncbi:unnamed protein product [Spirodela intermedia]|uniref:GH10 domain-containing protein n=1 Tax=Spirodela intermedia TaxID=51605 RepID=A0A7I8IYH0_SPIIN|nr:unnamed protein product [Spirodela intermedia]CAA6663014.1 unnamed protein product [Spirodela intermedia]